MPIYEYQCSSCKHKMEALQKISDDPLTNCPACDEADLVKLISAASFRLKGSGWYETDFKTGKKKQLAESESSTAKSDDSGKTAEKGKSADQQKSKSGGSGQGKDSTKAKPKDAASKITAKSS